MNKTSTKTARRPASKSGIASSTANQSTREQDSAKPDEAGDAGEVPANSPGQADGGRLSPLDGRFEADHRPSR